MGRKKVVKGQGRSTNVAMVVVRLFHQRRTAARVLSDEGPATTRYLLQSQAR